MATLSADQLRPVGLQPPDPALQEMARQERRRFRQHLRWLRTQPASKVWLHFIGTGRR